MSLIVFLGSLFGAWLLVWIWSLYDMNETLRRIAKEIKRERDEMKDRLRDAEDRLEQMLREREQDCEY